MSRRTARRRTARTVDPFANALYANDYADLPTAVADMTEGDILLLEGTYTLTAPISSPANNITLQPVPGQTATIVNNNATGATYSFSVTHDDVRFVGLNFRGQFTNRRSLTSSGDRTVVSSCTFDYAASGSGSLCCLFADGDGHQFVNNTVHDSTIAFDGAATITNSNVSGNTIDKLNGTGTAAVVTPLIAFGNVGSGHTIHNNTLSHDLAAIGISLGGTSPGSATNPANVASGTAITDNTIDIGDAATSSSVGFAGIYAMGDDLTVTGNIVYARSGVTVGAGTQPSAFTSAFSTTIGANQTVGVTNSFIADNEFYTDGAAGGQTVRLSGTDNTLTRNIIDALGAVDYNLVVQSASTGANGNYGRAGWGFRHTITYNTIGNAYDLPIAGNDHEFAYNTVYGHSQALTTYTTQLWDSNIHHNTYIAAEYGNCIGAQGIPAYIVLAGLRTDFYDNTIDMRGYTAADNTYYPIRAVSPPTTTGVIERNTVLFDSASGANWNKSVNLGGSGMTEADNVFTTV